MFAILLVLFLAWASCCDLRTRRIPDELPLGMLLAGLGGGALGAHPFSFGVLLLGALLGFTVGAGLFALGAMGGGDVKLLAGAGAVLGWVGLIPFFVHSSIAGGLLALAARARGRKEIPYAPAFLVGCLVSFALAGAGA